MSRRFAAVAPLVSIALVGSLLAGCGSAGTTPATGLAMNATSVKAEAAARKETRAQAEERAQRYIAEFEARNWRSINARTEMVEKIARTESTAAYDFLLAELESVQDLRDEMTKVTVAEADAYEETLAGLLDDLTPDQTEAKARASKAKTLKVDIDELMIAEERATGAVLAAASAHVGSRSRVLTAVQESKLYKAMKRAYKNTRAKVKKSLTSLCKKLRLC